MAQHVVVRDALLAAVVSVMDGAEALHWGLQEELIQRLSAGAQAGRASAAEKELERMKAEGLLQKPFVPKKRKFVFPSVERMGQLVLRIEGLTHGYHDRQLFDDVDLEIEKGERVAVIGVPLLLARHSLVQGLCRVTHQVDCGS
jgi:ABC-type transport system involved in cytochrome bd biosynthesis fused ATPase/permease subunit